MNIFIKIVFLNFWTTVYDNYIPMSESALWICDMCLYIDVSIEGKNYL